MEKKSYLITYDLMSPGQNYEKVQEAITSFGTWAKIQQSVWVVSTTYSGDDVYKKVRAAIDKNDKLAVFELTGNAWWTGLSNEVAEWIKLNL